MIKQTPWIERKFNFDFPVGMFPVIIERLKGTASRLRHITRAAGEDISSTKPEGKWSIKEEIGHLTDLEELHSGRIDDFLAGKKELRPADMTNKKTEAAQHNNRKLNELISDFESSRSQFLKRVENIDEQTALRSALHPRLKQPMRLIDCLYFMAEHDDHHLARIARLLANS